MLLQVVYLQIFLPHMWLLFQYRLALFRGHMHLLTVQQTFSNPVSQCKLMVPHFTNKYIFILQSIVHYRTYYTSANFVL